MKRILKLKKIKNTKHSKKYINRRMSNRVSFLKKRKLIFKIGSPNNTNEYLINEHSSPFNLYEEDEDSLNLIQSSLINISNGDEYSVLDYETISTIEKTIRSEERKEQKNIIKTFFR